MPRFNAAEWVSGGRCRRTSRRGDDPELQQAGRVVNRRGKRGKQMGGVVGMWQGCQQSRGSGKHRMHNKSRSAAGAVVRAIGAVLVGVILIGVILRRRLVAAWLWRGTAGSTGIMARCVSFVGFRSATGVASGICTGSRCFYRNCWPRCAAIVGGIACNPQRQQCVYRRKGQQLKQDGDMAKDIPHGNLDILG